MTAPNTEAWGLGTEPFPENVPEGVRGVDKFGNRTVTLTTPLEDGTTVMVEGIGTGANAGKPDGIWWPQTPVLAAGPKNAEQWVDVPTEPPINAPQPPQVDVKPDGTTIENPETLPTVVPAAPVATPKLTIEYQSGSWVVTELHATGQVITHEWTDLRHAVQNIAKWVSAHLHF